MKFKFEATQTIFKYFEVDADNEDEAFDMASKELSDGEIHFDDEPYLKVEYNLRKI